MLSVMVLPHGWLKTNSSMLSINFQRYVTEVSEQSIQNNQCTVASGNKVGVVATNLAEMCAAIMTKSTSIPLLIDFSLFVRQYKQQPLFIPTSLIKK